jgi:tetratricopeptide (TPR) repeat protein
MNNLPVTRRFGGPVFPTTTTEALVALDRGEYATALALADAGYEPDSLGEAALWHAELASYRYRLDEAEEYLIRCATLSGSLGLRRDTLEAEVWMLGGRFQEAADAFATLFLRARRDGDPTNELRIRVDQARVARMLCRFDEALSYARTASNLAEVLGAEYLGGVAAFNEAAALAELQDAATTREAYARAVQLLGRTERSRVWAHALLGLALVDVATGRYQAATDALVDAEAAFLALGSVWDLHIAGLSRGWSLYAGGQCAEANRLAERLVGEGRAAGDGRAELFALRLLASTRRSLEDIAGATAAAEEMGRLAGAVGSDVDRIEAAACRARARALGGDPEAIQTLARLASDADPVDSALAATIRVLRADALAAIDPLAGWREFREIDGAEGPLGLWYRAERAALTTAWTVRGFRVQDGELSVSLAGSLPLRRVARLILDFELTRAALEAADGNAAAAGRLVGDKRWNAARLAREVERETPRRSPRPRGGRSRGSAKGRGKA